MSHNSTSFITLCNCIISLHNAHSWACDSYFLQCQFNIGFKCHILCSCLDTLINHDAKLWVMLHLLLHCNDKHYNKKVQCKACNFMKVRSPQTKKPPPKPDLMQNKVWQAILLLYKFSKHCFFWKLWCTFLFMVLSIENVQFMVTTLMLTFIHPKI